MKSVKNFRYVEKTSAECNENSYLAILHLSRVELHCKLQEKLHRVNMAFNLMYNSWHCFMLSAHGLSLDFLSFPPDKSENDQDSDSD